MFAKLIFFLVSVRRAESKELEDSPPAKVVVETRSGHHVQVRLSRSELREWAQTHTPSFAEAAGREALVHSLISSGAWPAETWDEYQRFAAILGNVDSGELLLNYGVVPSVMEEVHDGTTRIHRAALLGLAIDDGDDLEAEAENGMRPLMIASAAGHAHTVRELLAKGADPRAKHKFAQGSPAHFAAELGHPAVLWELCPYLDERTALGGTPVHSAAQKNQFSTFQVLARCGADLNDAGLNNDTTPLYLAAHLGHLESVNALLILGADPDKELTVIPTEKTVATTATTSLNFFVPNLEQANGARPLHAAAEEGFLDVVTALLKHNADVDGGFSMLGHSPLQIAAQYNQGAVIRVLARHGASLDAGGTTALCYAVTLGHDAAVTALLEAGAHVDTACRGMTPLAYAAANGHLKILDRLLTAGADVGKETLGGQKALHAAKNIRIAEKLLHTPLDDGNKSPVVAALERGDGELAVFFAKKRFGADHENVTALAVHLGDPFLVQTLLNHGAPTRSSLCGAAATGRFEIAAVLLDHGADPDVVCFETTTPLLIAIERGDAHFVRTLLSNETEDGHADPNKGTTGVKQAPLLLAVARGAPSAVVEALLEANANCAILVASTKRPDHPPDNLIDIARGRRDFDVLNLLLDHKSLCDVRLDDLHDDELNDDDA